jgi:hypothetical protein
MPPNAHSAYDEYQSAVDNNTQYTTTPSLPSWQEITKLKSLPRYPDAKRCLDDHANNQSQQRRQDQFRDVPFASAMHNSFFPLRHYAPSDSDERDLVEHKALSLGSDAERLEVEDSTEMPASVLNNMGVGRASDAAVSMSYTSTPFSELAASQSIVASSRSYISSGSPDASTSMSRHAPPRPPKYYTDVPFRISNPSYTPFNPMAHKPLQDNDSTSDRITSSVITPGDRADVNLSPDTRYRASDGSLRTAPKYRQYYTDLPFPEFASYQSHRVEWPASQSRGSLNSNEPPSILPETPSIHLPLSQFVRTHVDDASNWARGRSQKFERIPEKANEVPQSRPFHYTDLPFGPLASANDSRREQFSVSRSRSRSRSRPRSTRRRRSSTDSRDDLDVSGRYSTLIDASLPTCERVDATSLGQKALLATPLRSIKLVTLCPEYIQREPGKSASTPSEITLQELSIETLPPFVALSYVWGNDNPSTQIKVNNEDFAIRENLSIALDQLQLLCPGRQIWTDAICIDQSNEEEKSHLVQHMGHIFSLAEQVYAWLGPAEHSSDALWQHLQETGDLFWEQAGHDRQLDQTPFDMEPIMGPLLPKLHARFSKPLEDGGFPTMAYTKFSDRVYWQRVWVLQEVYLAGELIFCCGSQTMDSKTLAGALILLESYQKHVALNENFINDNPRLMEFVFTAPCYPEMHKLLIYTSIYPKTVHSLRIAMTNFAVKELPRGSKSTDPRDMIFGLLGFANEDERAYIKVDYSKTVQEVYRDATRVLLQRGWTDILSWSQAAEKQIPGLPNWVPDYSATIFESMCSQGQAKPWLSQFQASANLKRQTYVGDVKGVANLRWAGALVDTVEVLGSLWHPRATAAAQNHAGSNMPSRTASYESILQYLREIRDFTDRSVHLHSNSPHAISNDKAKRLEAAWRVPCADQLLVDAKFVRDGTMMQAAYMAAMADLQQHENETEDVAGASISDEGRRYVETMLRWVKKRPMLSASGYVGLVPGDTQQGDILVLLQDCNAPYVLRPCVPEHGEMSHELIGEAFVWGIMDGEYTPKNKHVFNIV